MRIWDVDFMGYKATRPTGIVGIGRRQNRPEGWGGLSGGGNFDAVADSPALRYN
jgi:hypothetical protein